MSLRSSINSAFDRLNPLAGLVRKIPRAVWLIAVGLALVAAWFHWHDAQVRQKALQAVARRQTAAQVSTLEKQAAASLQAANVADAKAITKLQARRQELEQQNRKLTARLALLRAVERKQVQRVATLPTREVVTRVAAQLGLGAQDLVPASGSGAPAAASGRTETLSGQTAGSPPAKTPPATGRPGASRQKISVLPLSASGARKVETALVELNACRSQSRVQNEMISNCQARAAAGARTITRQADSIRQLNQALAAKDKIAAAQQSACQAELRAARGTFWSRLGHTAKHVAIGVLVGVAVGMAVR